MKEATFLKINAADSVVVCLTEKKKGKTISSIPASQSLLK